jgi:hypothetical protein
MVREKGYVNRGSWSPAREIAAGFVAVLLMVVLAASPGLAAESPTGGLQKERTSVTLGFGEGTEEMADTGLTSYRAVVAPRAATGTVQFKADGRNLGSPVPIEDGVADSESIALSLGRVHTVEAEYSGDDRFEPSRDEWNNVRAIGDREAEASVPGPPGFQPSGLLIALLALLALALLIGIGVLYRRRRGRARAEG